MTWEELAECQRASAAHLLASREHKFVRAICSRAYYAAYALVVSRIPSGATFSHGWSNPPHAKLPSHVAGITNLADSARQAVRRALRRLRQRREDADYRPGVTIDLASARESMRDAAEVFRILDRS